MIFFFFFLQRESLPDNQELGGFDISHSPFDFVIIRSHFLTFSFSLNVGLFDSKKLKYVDFSGCPVAKLPNYRLIVISFVPRLKILDGVYDLHLHTLLLLEYLLSHTHLSL